MSRSSNTFYNYIMSNSSSNISRFRNTFGSRIPSLPDKIVSSKFLINHLDILPDSDDFMVFKNAFLEYFTNTFSNIR